MSEKPAKPKKPRATRQAAPACSGNLAATRTTRFGGEPRRRRSETAAKPKAAAKPQAADGEAQGRHAAPRPPRRTAARPCERARRRSESTERARAEAPSRRARPKPPSGTELVTTAIQAAGELAQIGLTVGGQVLKRAVERLPKP